MLKKTRKIIVSMVLGSFIASSIQVPVFAQIDPMPFMPRPGEMVLLSSEFAPAYLKGIVVHPEDPFKFDFIINRGDKHLNDAQKRQEYAKLTKYFLASLAIPDEDQWVNLSPYEKDRIIKDDFGRTEMGRDLLAQDYMLKQITASLIYPQGITGKEFWAKVYAQARKRYGTTNIPVNTFNKVWILPDDALIYEKGNTAYVLKNHLRVMMEEDYLSLQRHSGMNAPLTHSIASNIVKEIVLPEIEREVNEDKNFAPLRQVYSGMLLATWFKRSLKRSLLGQIYADKTKVKGVDQDPRTNEAIYQQYLKAYKKGVFDFIKADVDDYTHETIPRKYFSGGAVSYAMMTQLAGKDIGVTHSLDAAQSSAVAKELSASADFATVAMQPEKTAGDWAMKTVPQLNRRKLLKLSGKTAALTIALTSLPRVMNQAERDQMREEQLGMSRLKSILAPGEMQGNLEGYRDQLMRAATFLGRMDQEHFNLLEETMEFRQKPASYKEFGEAYVPNEEAQNYLGIVRSFSDHKSFDYLKARTSLFKRLFVGKEENNARTYPGVFIRFLNESTDEDLPFFQEAFLEFPGLFNAQALHEPMSRSKATRWLGHIRALPPPRAVDLIRQKDGKLAIANTAHNREMTGLLRRYFLSVLQFYLYMAPIEENRRMEALISSLLLTISTEDEGENADAHGSFGYKTLLEKNFLGIVAHEQNHNLFLFGDSGNSILMEFSGHLAAEFLLQFYGANINYTQIEINQDERARSRNKERVPEGHYYAIKQKEMIDNAFHLQGWKINWEVMFDSLNSIERDYKDNKLNASLKQFVEDTYERTGFLFSTPSVFDLGGFTKELLRRYFQTLHQPMPEVIITSQNIKTREGGFRVVSFFTGFRFGDRAMIIKDIDWEQVLAKRVTKAITGLNPAFKEDEFIGLLKRRIEGGSFADQNALRTAFDNDEFRQIPGFVKSIKVMLINDIWDNLSLISHDSPLYVLGQTLGIKFDVPAGQRKSGYWKYRFKLTESQRRNFNAHIMSAYSSSSHQSTDIYLVFSNNEPLLLVSQGLDWEQIPSKSREVFLSMLGPAARDIVLKAKCSLCQSLSSSRSKESNQWIIANADIYPFFDDDFFNELQQPDQNLLPEGGKVFKSVYRPDEWTSRLFNQGIHPPAEALIIDLGTGAGYGALTSASRTGEKSEIIAIDKNPVAVANARYNVERSGFRSKIKVYHGDLFHILDGPLLNRKADRIYFNMPVANGGQEGDMATHDPQYGVLDRLLKEAPDYLKADGMLEIMNREEPIVISKILEAGWDIAAIDFGDFRERGKVKDWDYVRWSLVRPTHAPGDMEHIKSQWQQFAQYEQDFNSGKELSALEFSRIRQHLFQFHAENITNNPTHIYLLNKAKDILEALLFEGLTGFYRDRGIHINPSYRSMIRDEAMAAADDPEMTRFLNAVRDARKQILPILYVSFKGTSSKIRPGSVPEYLVNLYRTLTAQGLKPGFSIAFNGSTIYLNNPAMSTAEHQLTQLRALYDSIHGSGEDFTRFLQRTVGEEKARYFQSSMDSPLLHFFYPAKGDMFRVTRSPQELKGLLSQGSHTYAGEDVKNHLTLGNEYADVSGLFYSEWRERKEPPAVLIVSTDFFNRHVRHGQARIDLSKDREERYFDLSLGVSVGLDDVKNIVMDRRQFEAIKDSILPQMRGKIIPYDFPEQSRAFLPYMLSPFLRDFLKTKGILEARKLEERALPPFAFYGEDPQKRDSIPREVLLLMTPEMSGIRTELLNAAMKAKHDDKSNHHWQKQGKRFDDDQGPQERYRGNGKHPFAVKSRNSIVVIGGDDMSKSSYLDKHFVQWEFLRNHILPYLIDRALKKHPENPRLVVIDIGSSTGEEIARTFYEIMTALESRGEDPQRWKIEIRGIEKNKGVAVEAERRVASISGFYRRRKDERDTVIGGQMYADLIMGKLYQYPEKFQESVEIIPEDILRLSTEHLKDADLVLLNHVLSQPQYLREKSAVREDIVRMLSQDCPNAVMAIGDFRFVALSFNVKGLNHVFRAKDSIINAETSYYFGLPKAMAAGKEGQDAAMNNGGIDLNSANLSLLIKRDGQGVVLPIASQDLAQLSRLIGDGLEPKILSIIPASQSPVFAQLAGHS